MHLEKTTQKIAADVANCQLSIAYNDTRGSGVGVSNPDLDYRLVVVYATAVYATAVLALSSLLFCLISNV